MRTAETDSVWTLVEPLTRREGQMLLLLAEGYSRPEIAAKLTLAKTSVKFHIHNLYGKLGVNSKRQALLRANELGLLAPPLVAVLAARPGGPAAQPARKHNLPLQVTRFFGREAEITQLRDLLDDNRLVTLSGSGGVGKTRLSLRVAEEALTEFADGVWFVELAPLSDPEQVSRQIAGSLGLSDDPSRSTLETLTAYLQPRQALLVLDNCEHLLEACARVADALLRACPALTVLATSREPLGARGEALFRVPSLPFPDPAQPLAVERLRDFASVRLFVDRARLVLPDYQVAAHNAAPVARICQRLDGIPLALELAAARVKLLTAEQVAGRLDDTLGLLTGGGRSALARHQTLQATIDWSYTLLTGPERLLLQRLSVFAGGCTLAAAEAVCAGDDLPASQVLDSLTSLVDKSLVLADRQSGQDTRYRLLEMVRQYARVKLDAAGDSALRRSLHRDYFVEYVTRNVVKTNTAEEIPWAAALALDLDNLRLALAWSFDAARAVEAGTRLVVAMLWMWPSAAEESEWCARAVACCEREASIPPLLYAALLGPAAHLVASLEISTAMTWSQRAVAVSRQVGPAGEATLMAALTQLRFLYLEVLGDVERAASANAEAEAIFQHLGPAAFSPERYVTWAAHFAEFDGRLAASQGRHQDAKRLAGESFRLYQQVGSPNAADPLIGQGMACLALEEYEEARGCFQRVLQDMAALATSWAENRKNSALYWLGLVDLRQGHLPSALEHGRAGLSLAAELSDHIVCADCLGLLAAIAAKQALPARAARLSGAAKTLYAAKGRQPRIDSSLETLMPGWQAGLDNVAITQAFEAGQAMPAKAALSYALSETAVD